MRKFAFLIGIAAVVFSLSACSKRVDGRLMEPLKITVSKSQAAVGELVTVTLTGGFVNLTEAHSPDLIVPDFRLGTCFRQAIDSGGENQGGLCSREDLPLPSYVMISEGQSYEKAFGEQIVKSGEEVTLKHTFSFTSTEPGSVALRAVGRRRIEIDSSAIGVEYSPDVEIEFK